MSGRSILIVDDDKATCMVLALALKGEGYQCRLAHTCREALVDLEKGPAPDLILLDLLLPDANGAALLERLTSEPAWSRIPVIIMSAWGKAAEVARAARLELLSKPFSLAQAEALVRRLISPLNN
jgi:CheY-like chemotaxis protein